MSMAILMLPVWKSSLASKSVRFASSQKEVLVAPVKNSQTLSQRDNKSLKQAGLHPPHRPSAVLLDIIPKRESVQCASHCSATAGSRSKMELPAAPQRMIPPAVKNVRSAPVRPVSGPQTTLTLP